MCEKRNCSFLLGKLMEKYECLCLYYFFMSLVAEEFLIKWIMCLAHSR